MKRRNIMILMISLSLILLLGSSYALLRSTKVGSNPYVINVGTLQVTFEDNQTDALALENMYPMSDKEGRNQSDELGFTVKNTGTVVSYYDITLEETSTNPEFKSVIRFISNKDNQGYNEPKTLSEDKYIDVGGYLESNASSSYKVKVWLDYNAGNEYMDKTFTAKVLVNSFQESNYAKDVIKSKLVKYSESSQEDFTGGLVAVNTDGDLYNETDSSERIREYRYSGLNVNNYVTFNEEMWRIIGVFKDESGSEHVKIVRNEVLNEIFPETYIINDETYNIKGERSDIAYWNDNTSGKNNDWATAGLQYWLNAGNNKETSVSDDGYMSYLKQNAKIMIENIKYYLGSIGNISVTCKSSSEFTRTTTSYGIALEVYQNERAINEVYSEKEISQNCENYEIFPTTYEGTRGGKIWPGNNGIWSGKIGLLYSSDYGYSASTKNWIIDLHDYDTMISSWLNSANHVGNECLLSATSSASDRIAIWNNAGAIGSYYTYSYYEIRPTLYLKSNVKITSGDGTYKNPYQLSGN